MTDSPCLPGPLASRVETVLGPVTAVRDALHLSTHRRAPDAGGTASNEAAHLLIADVAQIPLRANSAAPCVRRTPDADLAPGRLTEFDGLVQPGEPYEGLFCVPMEVPPPDCHPYTVAVFRMLTHGQSYRALNRPTSKGVR